VPGLTRTRQNGSYTLTEQGTTKYSDLNMAQTVALAAVAEVLATTIRTKANNGQSNPNKEEAKDNHDDEQ
jgi:Tfp pilus assembly major pilin PilA